MTPKLTTKSDKLIEPGDVVYWDGNRQAGVASRPVFVSPQQFAIGDEIPRDAIAERVPPSKTGVDVELVNGIPTAMRDIGEGETVTMTMETYREIIRRDDK